MTEPNLSQSDNLPLESQAASPEDLVKDLEAEVSDADANSIVGGRKAGEGQKDYT